MGNKNRDKNVVKVTGGTVGVAAGRTGAVSVHQSATPALDYQTVLEMLDALRWELDRPAVSADMTSEQHNRAIKEITEATDAAKDRSQPGDARARRLRAALTNLAATLTSVTAVTESVRGLIRLIGN